ncbi:MAG: sulfurtransferase [Pirellulales bacterium]|nr:sulfurtransferase [Pirellulales bacterium]
MDQESPSRFTNIAAYQFAALADLKPLRAELQNLCRQHELRGTILLAPEGINLFVAGKPPAIEHLLARLKSIPGLEALTPKYSYSSHQPFRRMLVRIKREIIAFGQPGIDPARRTSPKLAPRELKQWLDEGRPVTLLDTRNDYEVKLGTFAGAVTLPIRHFRHFPAAAEQLAPELKKQPVVMFCTGGIRCEKAGPYLESRGFEHVLQLDGGILKYFEECGNAHYAGECFVFDQRVGVDPELAESDNTQCFACQEPLTAAEQADPRYVPGQSCPHCYRTPAEQAAETLARRQEALELAVKPLPGSLPYDNFRPIHIPHQYDGRELVCALTGVFPHIAGEEWSRLIAAGEILDHVHQRVTATRIVRAGETYLRLLPGTIEPTVNSAISIRYEDEALVIVDKPAPLPLHPCGRYNRNTLQNLLNLVYAPQKLRPAHRLDANTTGVVVLTRTRKYAGLVQPQFERGLVEKEYLARVRGVPREREFACAEPIRDCPGELGTRVVAANGQPAVTHFQLVREFADGTSLLRVRPLTGRTNQIRVHLWHLNLPICGDQAYLPDRKLGQTQTHELTDPPLCLHAWRITLTHPLSDERVTYEAREPEWCGGDHATRADHGTGLLSPGVFKSS